MSPRVVVYLRWKGASLRASGAGPFLEAARTLIKRATAFGGRAVAWDALGFGFEFDEDALEDALELITGFDGSRFGIGVSRAELAVVLDGGSAVALCWGPALVRAASLARIARKGEVLVQPSLREVKDGGLLTLGSRLGVLGRERLRGARLDTKHPWRAHVAEAVTRMTEPAFVDRPGLKGLTLERGTLCVVRVPRGGGGTRALAHLAERADRSLWVGGQPLGEPLGALRRGLLASRAAQSIELEPLHEASLDSLLAGEGLDPEAASALISAWLDAGVTDATGPDAHALIVIDDASDADADTLEAIVQVASHPATPCAVVARLLPDERLPESLAGLPPGPELTLGPLDAAPAGKLAQRCVGGALGARNAERWAKRASLEPLAVREAIAAGLESGDLLWGARGIAPRTRSAGRGAARAAEHFIERRWRFTSPAARTVLLAIAVLGGEAEREVISQLVNAVAEVDVDVTAEADALLGARWLCSRAPELLSLPSSSHRRAIVGAIDANVLSAWHRAAVRVLTASPGPLAAVSAVVHAVRAGDTDRAVELAERGAGAAAAVGLEVTARALESFTRTRNSEDLEARRLSGSVYPSTLVDAASAAALLDGARSGERPSFPPVDLPAGVREGVAELARVSGLPPVPRAPKLPDLPASALPDIDGDIPIRDSSPDLQLPDGSPRRKPPPVPKRRPDAAVELAPDALESDRPRSNPATAALKAGNVAELEQAVEQLRGKNEVLAERLRAMAAIAKGNTGEALRVLRRGIEHAGSLGPGERSRAQLALGVGLEAAGRPEEALLEALAGLARAREARDKKGAVACARFIAQLAERAGRTDDAATWRAVSE